MAGVSPDRLAHLLSLLQLSDSAFPSGRYTLSHGLEAFAQSGQLSTPAHPALLLGVLGDSLRYGVAPSDGIALACARRAVRGCGELDVDLATRTDARLTAVKVPRETREASTRTGRALMATAIAVFAAPPLREYAALVSEGRAPGNHAVVLGILDGWLEVPGVEAVAGELFAYCTSWVGAAVRLGLADHRTAQILLHQVRPATVAAAQWAAQGDVEHISSCTPMVDVMAMRHEEAGLRLFAS